MEDGKVMNDKLNVLYEDNHIIVVEKPCNILSQGDSTKDVSLMDIVKNYIKIKYHKPGNVYLGLIHRLDRPVGGIMVFARSSKAASRLTKAFSQHDITKKYLAIAHGKIEEDGEWKDYLSKDEFGNAYVSNDGKEAVLDYEILDYDKAHDCTLVSITLKTGRHHQIRVQFSSRGHYLLGDQRYGVLDHEQICLFSYYLSFQHPVTKENMEFRLMPPLSGYWKYFEKDF